MASDPAHALFSRANAGQAPALPLSLYDALTFGCYVAGFALFFLAARLFWTRNQQEQAFEAARQAGLKPPVDVESSPASTTLGEAARAPSLLWRSGFLLAWLAGSVLLAIPTFLSSSN